MRSYNARCIRYCNVPSRSFRLYTAVVSLSKTHKCLSCTGLSEKEGRSASLSASGSLWRSLTVYLVGKSGKPLCAHSCANFPLEYGRSCPLMRLERDSCPLTASLGRPWGRVKAGFAKDAVAVYGVASYMGGGQSHRRTARRHEGMRRADWGGGPTRTRTWDQLIMSQPL